MKTIAKITTAIFIVGTLLFTACGKDDNSQVPREKKLKSIEAKNEKTDTIIGTFHYFYDSADRISKINLQFTNQTDLFNIEFTYNAANKVENIRYTINNKSTDFTFIYDTNNKAPTKLTYSGSVPTYTADILNMDGSLFWKDNNGEDNILEDVNFENNTFKSLNSNGITYKFKENNQIKNGLSQKQNLIKLPLYICDTGAGLLLEPLALSLQISSAPIESIESSSGEALNYQLEKDADGYITKSKLTSQGNTLITTFHYE